MVRRHLATLSRSEIQQLETQIGDYVSFRDEVQTFLSENFSEICDQKCYRSRLSACCSREGIITFFADAVINALLSRNEDLEALITVLQKPNDGFKCIFLGDEGCLWQLKPIVCEMFLCDPAEKEAFEKKPEARQRWEDFRQREKSYRWPDRPVLFDKLEQYFIDAGYSSPLMYLHNSPGLLRVKRRAGLNEYQKNKKEERSMSKTDENVQDAFAGESQANRKYLFFGEKADKEGHKQIARLFRAAADAETAHARNHLNVIQGIKSTKENLQAAVSGENHEFTEMYPGFIKQAETDGVKEAIGSFDLANQVEEIHHTMFLDFLGKLEQGEVIEEKPIYVCQYCGNTVEGEAPDKCPVCGVPKKMFKSID